MESMDTFSYQCGVIDSFNEMVRAGVKALALSHPVDTEAERDALIPFSKHICRLYGTKLYPENDPLITDLFPCSLSQGKFLILFYREDHKAALVAEGAYFGGNRSRIAWEYGRLLSYPDEAIRRLIHENGDREIL